MIIKANTPENYLKELPEERKAAFNRLRDTILSNLPVGYLETISYGMIGYVVPHLLYPQGYHCNPKEPLPFMSIASQKNYIALYHLGLYSNEQLLNWFRIEYQKYSKIKLDMGKSCIRFKRMDEIPFELIGALCKKITVEDWIQVYTNNLKARSES